MPLYPTPQATDFVSLFSYAQSIVPFSQLVVIAVFFTSFFALKRYETLRALVPSIFITFLTSLFFYLMNLIQVEFVYATIVALGVSIILLYFHEKEY